VLDEHVQFAQPGLVEALVDAGRGERARAAETQRIAVVGDGFRSRGQRDGAFR
jgi:hypothetical protein